jgi:hypothetical protein
MTIKEMHYLVLVSQPKVISLSNPCTVVLCTTSTLEANWEVPANYKDIIRSTFWSINKKSPVGGNYSYISSDDIN